MEWGEALSIKWKITLAMFLSSLIVVITMGFISVSINQQTLEKRASEFMTDILARNEYEVTQQVVATENVIQSIFLDLASTYNSEKALIDQNYRNDYLDRMKASVKVSAEINRSSSAFLILLDPLNSQHVLGSVLYEDRNRDGIPEEINNSTWTDQEFFKGIDEHISKQAPYSWISNASENSMICYSLLMKDQKAVALVGANMNKGLIKERLRSTKYLTSGYLFLLDENNQVIYHPSIEEGQIFKTGFNEIPSDPLKVEILSLKTDFVNIKGLTGSDVIRAERTLKNGWKIGLEVEMANVLKGLDQIFVVMILLMIGALIMAFGIGLYSSSRIGKPYIRLSHQIEKMDSEIIDLQLDQKYLHRKDEAGILYRSFEQLIKRLKLSFEEVTRYNQNLENLVEERTNALIITNNNLEEALATSEEKQALLYESNNQLELSLELVEKTQKELLKIEKIASLSYLVSGISHQMNTPLGNAITSVSYLNQEIEKIRKLFKEETLKRSDLEECLEVALESTNGIMRSLEKSSKLIERFKGTSVLEQVEVIKLIRVADFVKDYIEVIKTTKESLNCQFIIEIPSGLEFRCRRSNFLTILDELVKNALDHAFEKHSSPQIRIQIHSYQGEPGAIEILFRDNGLGVESSQLNHLFTPFYTTKMGVTHNGLGLNMVYNLIYGIYKGDIDVTSNEGEGLTFRIVLYEEAGEVS